MRPFRRPLCLQPLRVRARLRACVCARNLCRAVAGSAVDADVEPLQPASARLRLRRIRALPLGITNCRLRHEHSDRTLRLEHHATPPPPPFPGPAAPIPCGRSSSAPGPAGFEHRPEGAPLRRGLERLKRPRRLAAALPAGPSFLAEARARTSRAQAGGSRPHRRASAWGPARGTRHVAGDTASGLI